MGCMEMIKDDEEFWKVMAQRRAMQEKGTQSKEYLMEIDFNKLREICPHRINSLCGTLKYYDCSKFNCPLAVQKHKFDKKTIDKAFEMERKSDKMISFKKDTECVSTETKERN